MLSLFSAATIVHRCAQHKTILTIGFNHSNGLSPSSCGDSAGKRRAFIVNSGRLTVIDRELTAINGELTVNNCEPTVINREVTANSRELTAIRG
jgi:hypothetical protein